MRRSADGLGRLDLHNISVDYPSAVAGRCGFTHLETGRICLLPHRHSGPCRLQISAGSVTAVRR